MDLLFRTSEFQKRVESAAGCATLVGAQDGAVLGQRLNELAAAENLAIITTLPALALQRIGSDGRFSIQISTSKKLMLEAIDFAGGDLATITCVRVIGIERA